MTHKYEAYLLTTDSKEKEIAPADGVKFTTEELLHHLKIDKAQSLPSNDDNYAIICDEEGKLKKNPRVNVKATLMYKLGNLVPVVGNVIICNKYML